MRLNKIKLAGFKSFVDPTAVNFPSNLIGVVGPNGCGKTALLRTALGEIPPLRGDVRLAPSVKVGYFDQDNRLVPPDVTALEAVLGTGRDETLIRTVMGRMGVRKYLEMLQNK